MLELMSKISADGGHSLKIEGTLENVVYKIYSEPRTINQVVNDKLIEIEKSKGMDPEYEAKKTALKDLQGLKKTLGNHVGAYKRAVDNAYKKGGKKSDITKAYGDAKSTLDQIAAKFEIIGVQPKDWIRPGSKVLKTIY